MIIQGLKLTILGMGVVFCFLVLLLLLIFVLSKLMAPFTAKEISMAAAKKPPRPRNNPSSGDNLKLTAIISAAVAAHRAQTRR